MVRAAGNNILNCIFTYIDFIQLTKIMFMESVQCISIVYSICPYEYNQWAASTGRKKSNSSLIFNCIAAVILSSFCIILTKQ